jgi:hypothetical protein
MSNKELNTLIEIDFNKLPEFKQHLIEYNVHNYILDLNDDNDYGLIIYYDYKIFSYTTVSKENNKMLLQLREIEPVKQTDNIFVL